MTETTRTPSGDANSVADPRSFYFARQAILDDHGRVFGYELLYRSAPGAARCEVSSDLASARVLTAAVSSLGLDVVTAGRPAFVNFTRSLLLNSATLLAPTAMVIELHEDIPVDQEVIDACERLNDAGYALGLDDFVAGSDAEALLPFIKFVKVDVLQTTPVSRAELSQRLSPQGIRLIAEKVETAEMAAETRAEGYRLFQGYHFLRPTTFTAKNIPGGKANYLRLLTALSQPDLSVAQLEDLVKTDADITYRVLSSINSSAYSLRREVSSIREALVLLGRDQIRKWASVWVLACLNRGGTPETLSVALLRARACERLGQTTGHLDLFLLGLCSVLDVIVERPMAELVMALPLSKSIRDALLGRPGGVRPILDAVIAYERGHWDEAIEAAARLKLPPESLSDAYTDALVSARMLATAA